MNYEILHQAAKPIQSKTPLFIRKENGEVETKFLVAPPEKKDGLKIQGFREDGKPCYEGKSSTGHIWWDVCNCIDC